MKYIQRLLLASLGAVLIHTGVVFMTQAGIGVDSVTLFMQALANSFGTTLGISNAVAGVVFAFIAFVCDKKKIGFATLFYIVSSHFVIDGLMMVILPSSNYLIKMVYMLLCISFISLGSALCVSARVGLSFYDAFLYSVTDRFNINYLVFRYSVEAVLTIVAMILHVFHSFGTVIYLIVMGPCVSAVLKKIKGPIRRYFGLKEEY